MQRVRKSDTCSNIHLERKFICKSGARSGQPDIKMRFMLIASI